MATQVEVRSIDYVPLSERHGKLWHLGPLWFMGNAQIATLAVGVVGVSIGGDLLWSLIAIFLGVFVGTFFMAFHSAQGPQLGLPQMVQSRPQFGYVGALLVWLFAYVQYAGFNVFNTILAGDAGKQTIHLAVKPGIAIATLLAVVVALIGYDFIHRVEQGLTYAFLLIWGSALGGFWLMALGSLLAASAGKSFDTVKSIYGTGNGIFDGFGTIVLLFSALGLISVTALNLYGGSPTLISAVDSFRKVRPTLLVRVVMIGFTGALSLVVAFAASANFLDNFNSFLLLILYLFVPWTAVNLIDYYVVRRGHYAVAEIFKPDGIYGRAAAAHAAI